MNDANAYSNQQFLLHRRGVSLLILWRVVVSAVGKHQPDVGDFMFNVLLNYLASPTPMALYDRTGGKRRGNAFRFPTLVPEEQRVAVVLKVHQELAPLKNDSRLDSVSEPLDRWLLTNEGARVCFFQTCRECGVAPRSLTAGFYNEHANAMLRTLVHEIESDLSLERGSPASPARPQYLDSTHPRYSPKLAAAVAAWLAVEDGNGRHPKQAIEKYLREHARELGLLKKNGLINEEGIADCAKVANWKTSGGAPKTPRR